MDKPAIIFKFQFPQIVTAGLVNSVYEESKDAFVVPVEAQSDLKSNMDVSGIFGENNQESSFDENLSSVPSALLKATSSAGPSVTRIHPNDSKSQQQQA